MKTVWKYPFKIADEFTLTLPDNAIPLRVAAQGADAPFLWALVDPTGTPQARHFILRGTGHSIEDDENLEYVGTFTTRSGSLVWHVFEREASALTVFGR